jgi:hypothetical protein
MLSCGARTPCPSQEHWEEDQRAYLPQPSWVHPFARRHWRAALDSAQVIYEPPVEFMVHFVPVWWCDNDIDIPICDWRPTVALLGATIEESQFAPDECVDHPLHARGRAQLRTWVVGALARTAHYPPELRCATHGPYAAVRQRPTLVISVHDVKQIDILPAPTDAVPAYSLCVAPAVSLRAEDITLLKALIAEQAGEIRLAGI